jgi:hypothetical protein
MPNQTNPGDRPFAWGQSTSLYDRLMAMPENEASPQLRANLAQPGGHEAFDTIARLADRYGPQALRELYDMATSPDPAPEPDLTPAMAFRDEGRAQGRVETLMQVLTVKFGPLPDSVSATVRGASTDLVEAWTVRAVTAEALDRVFDASAAASQQPPQCGQANQPGPAESPPPPEQPISLDSVYQQILGMPEVEGAALVRAVLDEPDGQDTFATMLMFIAQTSVVSAGELRDLAASFGPVGENAYLATAETFRAEGHTRGRAIALFEVLKVKFDTPGVTVLFAVIGASRDQLAAWTARAMTVETLDQVFADGQRPIAGGASGGPATVRRPVASGQSRPRSHRPVADIISEQRG